MRSCYLRANETVFMHLCPPPAGADALGGRAVLPWRGRGGRESARRSGQRGSLNFSRFVAGRSGPTASQILPFWPCWQWTDLRLHARSSQPAQTPSVDGSYAETERTRRTLAG